MALLAWLARPWRRVRPITRRAPGARREDNLSSPFHRNDPGMGGSPSAGQTSLQLTSSQIEQLSGSRFDPDPTLRSARSARSANWPSPNSRSSRRRGHAAHCRQPSEFRLSRPVGLPESAEARARPFERQRLRVLRRTGQSPGPGPGGCGGILLYLLKGRRWRAARRPLARPPCACGLRPYAAAGRSARRRANCPERPGVAAAP